MNDMRQEQRLLDRIEDARLDAQRFRRLLVLGIVVVVVGILLIVFGTLLGVWGTFDGTDTGAVAGGAIMFGVILMLLAGVATLIHYNNDDGDTQRALRKAERAYRDYLIGSM